MRADSSWSGRAGLSGWPYGAHPVTRCEPEAGLPPYGAGSGRPLRAGDEVGLAPCRRGAGDFHQARRPPRAKGRSRGDAKGWADPQGAPGFPPCGQGPSREADRLVPGRPVPPYGTRWIRPPRPRDAGGSVPTAPAPCKGRSREDANGWGWSRRHPRLRPTGACFVQGTAPGAPLPGAPGFPPYDDALAPVRCRAKQARSIGRNVGKVAVVGQAGAPEPQRSLG